MSSAAEPLFSASQKDTEGLILANEETEQSFVVDCPALHIIPASALDIGSVPRGTPADLLYLGLSRYCPLCRSCETFTKARRVPMAHPISHHPRYNRYANISSLPISISPPPPTVHPDVSEVFISSVISDEDLPELASTIPPSESRFDPNESIFPFSPTPSLQRLHIISEHNEPHARPPTQASTQASPPRIRGSPVSYPPPSVVSISTESSSPTSDKNLSISPRLSGFFSRKKKKGASKIEVLESLPSTLSFTFSTAGHNLILWRKNGHSLIHIKIASWESKTLALKHTLPAQDPDRGINIKLVAEGNGWISVILYYKQQFLLLMIHHTRTQHSLFKLDTQMRPITLAISRDNALVAVGYGNIVHLYHYESNMQSWRAELIMDGFKGPDEVKSQIISFSNDCQFITVANQRFDIARGKDDDGMHARVWRCEENVGESFKLDHCRLPTDHIGITSAFFNPDLSLATMTAFIDSPYPLFLAPISSSNSPLAPPPLSKRFQSHFKARCAAQSTNAAYTSFLTDTNKLYLVNLKTKAVEEWADLAQYRRRELDPREEVAAMSMPGEKTCYVVWRDGAKLMLCTVMARNRAECKDLRWLIDDAGWGD